MRFDPLNLDPEVLDKAQDLLTRAMVAHSAAAAREEGVSYAVSDGEKYRVTLYSEREAVCGCGAEAPCAHMAAAWMKSRDDGRMACLTRKNEAELGLRVLNMLDRALPGGDTVRITIQLRPYEDGRLGLGLNLGRDRMYAVKNLQELITCRALGIPLVLSEKYTCDMGISAFRREDDRFLSLIENYLPLKAETVWENTGAMPDTAESPAPKADGRWLMIDGPFRRAVLKYLEDQPFVLQLPAGRQPQNGIRRGDLPLCFPMTLTATELCVSVQGLEDIIPLTPDCAYLLRQDHIIHIEADQARLAALLLKGGTVFRYPARDTRSVLETLMPSLSAIGTVVPDAALSARLTARPFSGAVYLDALPGGAVQARVSFRYGDTEIDPFAPAGQDGDPEAEPADGRMLVRDGRAETALLDVLSEAGFVVRGGKALLRRPRDILNFCTQGVSDLSRLCEVYASQDFEKIKPRRLRARAVFHMNGGRLVMTLLEESGNLPEVPAVLSAVARRQQYVRLKTGEFLDLRDLTALAPVMQEVLDAAHLDDPSVDDSASELNFSAYRAAYMTGMLRLAGADTETDAEVDQAAEALGRAGDGFRWLLPDALREKLKDYQLRGYDWIMSLYDGRMGGVLADEMGLGKTAQVIAALAGARAKDGMGRSLIVTPTSLTYHWLAELRRFDDSLTVRVITGPREQRRREIEQILNSDEVDVILTSYPLLRRDIDLISRIPLRFAVLDEAQSVKNAQSQGAEAAKELNAQVRLALTGTPMENHTGELWSIFDYVLPGYLGTQAAFLRRYGSGEHSDELRDRVRPFLMRRLKKDVLENLPEKHEQDLFAAMTPEQEQVYNTLLSTLRAGVGDALENGSLSRARIQVLSILLKLRQVCCHPRLYLADYEGTSGKLELLVQTVQNGIAGRRRMLIFSQFVGMLQLIRKRLNREGIQTLYLDGQTGPEERQNLCDRFNSGDGHVFLISLKAGGTGLNLIGADLVIHYDPWWNPAAEDQATDRAHRIGQSRDVDVIRLISQGTIEEKVTELSRRKRAVFDRVVMAGEAGFEGLTEEDIRALFFS